MRLSDAKEKVNLIINNINIQNKSLKNYLHTLGIVKNTKIKIFKKSFLNGPIIINIRNYQLSISKEISNNIEVEYL